MCVLISCFDQEQREFFSEQDPLFLGLNDELVSCDFDSVQTTSLREARDEFSNLVTLYFDGRDFDYLSLSQNSQMMNQLCQIQKTYFEFDEGRLSKNQRAAFFINAYKISVITLIASRFDEVLRPGFEDIPQNRSLLFIGDRGTRAFEEFKFPVANAYLSLDEIEFENLLPENGPLIHFALYRGARGFFENYQTAFDENNLNERLDELANNYVNNITFFDDFEGEETVFTTEFIKLIQSSLRRDPENRFTDIRSFLAFYNDPDFTGVESSDLFNRDDQNNFVWKLDFSTFIDWQLNEK